MFREDSKRFYRELGKKTIQIEKPPDIGEVKKFWQNILEQEVTNTMRMPSGLRTRRKNCSKSTRWSGRTPQLKNWGSTWPEQPTGNHMGPDILPNFWIKQFKSLHKALAEAYSEIIKDPKQTPDWLVEGSTNLLPKKEETWIPKHYRPIACLPTTFKILTSVITDRLYSHLEKRNHLATKRERKKERLPWMQGSVDDQQCYLRKLQEEEEELVNSLDRLQESLWQCIPFLDTQMPPDVQDPPSLLWHSQKKAWANGRPTWH